LKIILLGAVLFLLLEMSTRVYYFGFAGLVPAKINSVHGLPKTGFTKPSVFPGINFELKPNIDDYFQLVPFRTNSQGLRDREYSIEKPDNTFRVAVVGSSFALPSGVDIEQAFHTLLENRLTEQYRPIRYEFINFAVGMYNPRQILATLELRALTYNPDLVLFTTTKHALRRLVTGNVTMKQDDTALTRMQGNRLVFQKSYPFFQSYFSRLLEERTGHGPEISEFHVGAFEGQIIWLVEYLKKIGILKSEEAKMPPQQTSGGGSVQFVSSHGSVLQRLSQVTKKTGIPVVIVRLETEAKKKHPIHLKMEKYIRVLGLYYLDTRNSFEGTRPGDFWIHELDMHPNWKANEIFADAIAEFLVTNDLTLR